MEPLAGWTVGVTADRRAVEQIAMLGRNKLILSALVSSGEFGSTLHRLTICEISNRVVALKCQVVLVDIDYFTGTSRL